MSATSCVYSGPMLFSRRAISWQQDYNEKWESLEIQLGRSGFNDLFGHIRMIRMKAKAKKSLQEIGRAHV